MGALNEKSGGKLRNAIAAESGQACDTNISLEVIRKSEKERNTIKEALGENTFMKNMNQEQQNLIIDVMVKRTYATGTEIIAEGSDGNEMYILEKGEVNHNFVNFYSLKKQLCENVKQYCTTDIIFRKSTQITSKI